jgi:hypothetical protein
VIWPSSSSSAVQRHGFLLPNNSALWSLTVKDKEAGAGERIPHAYAHIQRPATDRAAVKLKCQSYITPF